MKKLISLLEAAMTVVLNDLFDYNLKIYQDSEKFKFSLDSLLLSEFVDIKKNDRKLLDLCSGNAPLPLILASKFNLSITGVEVQKEIYDLAQKSIKHNHLENKITMLNINALDINNYFPNNNFDIITCNPPFFKVDNISHTNNNLKLAIARHELMITLKDIFKISYNQLKPKGKLYLVHRPERLEEIFLFANQYQFHVKEIEFIYTNPQDYAIMVLLKLVKNSKVGVKIGNTLLTKSTQTYQNIFKRR